MSGTAKKAPQWEERKPPGRSDTEEWGYPTGMVWCPMKMSGMAIMKCARLQKDLGCGNLRQFNLVRSTNSGKVPRPWPWLRLRHGCPERASEEEVRDLRRILSPLIAVAKSRNNPRAYRCPDCGGRKVFGARRCRRCWGLTHKRHLGTFLKTSFIHRRSRS